MLNKSNFNPFYATTNLPNGYRDSVTGTAYPYDTGDAAGREAALQTLRDAQITEIASLISGGYLAAGDYGDLNKVKAAYAAAN